MQLDIEEKFFLENKNTEHVDNFNKIHKEVSVQKTEFNRLLQAEGFETDQVERFTKASNSYKETFDNIDWYEELVTNSLGNRIIHFIVWWVHYLEFSIFKDRGKNKVFFILKNRRWEKIYSTKVKESSDGLDSLDLNSFVNDLITKIDISEEEENLLVSFFSKLDKRAFMDIVSLWSLDWLEIKKIP